MATTSSINPYISYPAISSGSVAGLLGGASATSAQAEERYNAVKLLYQTTKQFKADQTAYRQQIRDFSANARSLASGSFTLKYLSAGTDSDQALAAVKSTLSAYNNLTTSLGKATNLTAGGTKLVSSLDNVMDTTAGDLETIGITQDEKSGQWKVDDKKFTDAMTKTPQKVQQILGGDKGLGGQLAATGKQVLATPAADYFKTPTSTNNSQTLRAAFSRGIFLDLLA